MKKILLVLLVLLPIITFGQKTFQFAEKDGQKLFLDVYKAEKTDEKKPLLIYVFGGGFIMGERNDTAFLPFIKKFNSHGFNVVCIDYRLGLKNAGEPGALNFKPLIKAIDMAVEDLLSATDFLLKNSASTGVNASNTVLIGFPRRTYGQDRFLGRVPRSPLTGPTLRALSSSDRGHGCLPSIPRASGGG